MGESTLDDTKLSRNSLFYDRRCPRCAAVLPKGWHVETCHNCKHDLRNKRIVLTRLARRCPYCNKVIGNLLETFCRHCLMNVEHNGMSATWFDGDKL